jgi:hypothetical protein
MKRKEIRLYLVFSVVLTPVMLHAQYYYQDIVSQYTGLMLYKSLLENRVNSVSATAYDKDGELDAAFRFRKQVRKGGSEVWTELKIGGEGINYTKETYTSGRLYCLTDSSGQEVSQTKFLYNDGGLPAQILISYANEMMGIKNEEKRLWQYENERPLSMQYVGVGGDTNFVLFKADSSGKITDEIWQQGSTQTEHYFYYYNEQGLLSDIVRYHARAAKLLPDFVFDYDKEGHLIRLIQFDIPGANRTTWLYNYDARQLKTSEIIYDKDMQEIGRVVYTYQ